MGRETTTGRRAAKAGHDPEHEAFLRLQRTADALMRGVAELLKPAGLSPAQFNVLRILRGAGAEGATCGQVGERLVKHDPDITRLLDRLEARKLIVRTREPEDRRIVRTRVTADGLRVLQELDAPMAALHRRQLGHVGERRLRTLVRLLDIAGANAP